eukprot:scaffold112285_cov36-Phaeocystis_antarctica.AAC.1
MRVIRSSVNDEGGSSGAPPPPPPPPPPTPRPRPPPLPPPPPPPPPPSATDSRNHTPPACALTTIPSHPVPAAGCPSEVPEGCPSEVPEGCPSEVPASEVAAGCTITKSSAASERAWLGLGLGLGLELG